jgi:hypothetical protein
MIIIPNNNIILTSAVVVPPPSYLVEENFEGTGTPSGWTPIGTVDFDYTTTVLQGAQSCYLDGTSGWAAILLPGISAQSECWVYFLLQTAALPLAERRIFRMRDVDGNVELFAVNLLADGTLKILQSGANGVTTVGSITTATKHHIWVYYKKGTGSDGVASVGFSTTGTRPTSGNNFAQLTNGTSVLNATTLWLETETSGLATVVDRVLLVAGSTAIPDNP